MGSFPSVRGTGPRCFALQVAGIGFIFGFLLTFRSVRNAVWVLAAYLWFRGDPIDFLLWLGVALGCALAWSLLRAAAEDAGYRNPRRQAAVLD